MVTHPRVLACRIPGTEEPGGLWSKGSPRVGHDGSNLARILDISARQEKEWLMNICMYTRRHAPGAGFSKTLNSPHASRQGLSL